jgi:hypothetical protein
MARYSERNILAVLAEPGDHNAAGIDLDSFHAGRIHEAAIAVLFGALTANSVLKVYVGATEGAKTTAIAFKYRFSQGDFKAASADLYGAATAVAATGLTLTAATFDHRVALIEIDSQAIPDATPWVTVEIDDTATALNVAALLVGTPRNASNEGTTIVK